MILFEGVTIEQVWVAIGLLGQSCFFFRMLIQWWASERAGRSVLPTAFWYLSVAGALIVLAYAVYKRDPVFIIGQLAGLFVYSRNLFLIHRHKRATKVETDDPAVSG